MTANEKERSYCKPCKDWYRSRNDRKSIGDHGKCTACARGLMPVRDRKDIKK